MKCDQDAEGTEQDIKSKNQLVSALWWTNCVLEAHVR